MSRRGVDENSTLARLAAAIHPTDPHPDRVLAASDADALDIVQLARQHRVSALLARELERGGRLDSLPGPARDALRRSMLDATMDAAAMERLKVRCGDALDGAAVAFLLLKGAALDSLVYPERRLRPMTDIDVLVAPRDVEGALAALSGAGFETPTEREIAFWRDAYYNLPARDAGPGGGLVEIHWSLAQSARRLPDVAGLFARAREFEQDNRRWRALGPEDLLLHQALHHSHHYFEPKLVWIYDLALLHRAAPPAEEVFVRARSWGVLTPLALSVLQVEKAFPGAADRGLLELASRSGRALVIRALFGARDPVVLINRWNRRRRQLLLAVLMLDRPTAAVRAVGSWLRRTIRYGDRAGHRIGMKRP